MSAAIDQHDRDRDEPIGFSVRLRIGTRKPKPGYFLSCS